MRSFSNAFALFMAIIILALFVSHLQEFSWKEIAGLLVISFLILWLAAANMGWHHENR